MEAKRKVYTPEFKAQAVRMVTDQELGVAEVACRHGAYGSWLHEWK
jgi:transposase-like protein